MRQVHSTFDLDARIRAIAAKQLGLITIDQARKRGVDRFALGRRRDAGALVSVFPGVVRLASFASPPAQHALAASLAVPGSIVAATSAAMVHQLPVSVGRDRADAIVTLSSDKRVRIPGITVVRQTTPLPSTRWMTTHVATPAATLLLLPRFVDDWTLERCLDHMLAHQLCTVANVRRLLDLIPTRAVHKRQLLIELLGDRASGIGHRSAKEQRVARWLRNAGFTGWIRNLKVSVDAGNEVEVEVDFGWSANRLALEVSPFFTHGSREKQARDAQRRRLLVANGWRVVEATDRDLTSERALGRTLSTLRSLGAT